MITLPVEGTLVRASDGSEAIFIAFSKDFTESLVSDDHDALVWVSTNDLLFV